MPKQFNPRLEEPMITIYLTDDALELSYATVQALEQYVNREIGIGEGFINVYTVDQELADRAALWLQSQGFEVDEIALGAD